MRLFHLLASHDPDSPTGVPRFSGYFKRAFPDVLNITPGTVGLVNWLPGDVCVTDNHLVMLLPPDVRAIVVNHGCAPYHHEVDVAWRNPETDKIVADQHAMLKRPNTVFVAPSVWVASKFRQIVGATPKDPKGYVVTVIPHWVEENTPTLPEKVARIARRGGGLSRLIADMSGGPVRAVIIGDWRTLNKGSGIIDKYRASLPQYEFRQLDFPGGDTSKREAFYRAADLYLCLSLSEGAPYSVADAEAASLPIVSTMVGNCYEFPRDDFYGIAWRMTPDGDIDEAANAIRAALETGRRTESFFTSWTFEKWKAAWREVIRAIF